jgi:DNA-binding MarR family transcriptional regulator
MCSLLPGCFGSWATLGVSSKWQDGLATMNAGSNPATPAFTLKCASAALALPLSLMLPIRQHLLTLTCLKSTAKAVLIEVCELAENGGKGSCFASNPTLAESLGISLKTLTRKIEELEAAGLLTRLVVKAEANRRYLRPTPLLRACYAGGTEAQQLSHAAELTIVRNAEDPEVTIVKSDRDYSQNCPVTIVKSDRDYSQNGSRVIGDDQYDQVDDQHDQPLRPSERAVFEKKIGDLQAQVNHLKAQLATSLPNSPKRLPPLSRRRLS